MAGSKALAGLAVLLASGVLLAATATAVDDEHMYHLKCYTSCSTRCQDKDNAAVEVDGGGHNASVSVVLGGGHGCKKGCLNECFDNYPALCYQQCVVSNCLCKPPCERKRINQCNHDYTRTSEFSSFFFTLCSCAAFCVSTYR
jgi:hypothetical protein